MRNSILKGKLKYEGITFKTKNCGDVIVVEYKGALNVIVKFVDTGYVTNTRVEDLHNGAIRDYLKPSVHGIGILGAPRGTQGGFSKEYKTWCRMLKRCYCEKSLCDSPTYLGCSVSDYFRVFTNFKDWCNKQVGFNTKDTKGSPFVLDKDVLIKGNKIYSEDTCCFIPQELNSVLTNSKAKRGEYPLGVSYERRVSKFQATLSISSKNKRLGYFETVEEAFFAYKEAKESQIKVVVERWKEQIDPRVYEALMNYQIEITD